MQGSWRTNSYWSPHHPMWPPEKGCDSATWSVGSCSAWASLCRCRLVGFLMKNLLWNRQGGQRHVTRHAGMICGGYLHPHSAENQPTLPAVSMQLCWLLSPQETGSHCLSPHSCTGSAVEDTRWEPCQLHKENGHQFRVMLERTAEAQLHLQPITKSPRLIRFFLLRWLFLPVPLVYLPVTPWGLHFLLLREKEQIFVYNTEKKFCAPLHHFNSVFTSWDILGHHTLKPHHTLLHILQF